MKIVKYLLSKLGFIPKLEHLQVVAGYEKANNVLADQAEHARQEARLCKMERDTWKERFDRASVTIMALAIGSETPCPYVVAYDELQPGIVVRVFELTEYARHIYTGSGQVTVSTDMLVQMGPDQIAVEVAQQFARMAAIELRKLIVEKSSDERLEFARTEEEHARIWADRNTDPQRN